MKKAQKSLVDMQIQYVGKNVPHLVLEVNQKCNIDCRSCYKQKYNYSKPLETIKEEIDIALRKRNLDEITIAGGEPTLHPDLAEIIRYIKKKKVHMCLLTNGLIFNPQLLEELREAGLEGISLHIDTFQNRPDIGDAKSEKDLNSLRARISKMVRDSGIRSDFAMTLYRENIDQLGDIVQWLLEADFGAGLLAVISRNFDFMLSGFKKENVLGIEYVNNKEQKIVESQPEPSITMADVRKVLLTNFGMEPSAYVPGSKNKLSERWLFYRSLVIKKKNGTNVFLHFSSDFKKVTDLVYFLSKKIKANYPFHRGNSSWQLVAMCLLYAGLSFKLKTIFEVIGFLSNLMSPGARIYQKRFVFQQPPNLTPDGGIEYCSDCPDATIRNGELIPLCLADYLSPLKNNS